MFHLFLFIKKTTLITFFLIFNFFFKYIIHIKTLNNKLKNTKNQTTLVTTYFNLIQKGQKNYRN